MKFMKRAAAFTLAMVLVIPPVDASGLEEAREENTAEPAGPEELEFLQGAMSLSVQASKTACCVGEEIVWTFVPSVAGEGETVYECRLSLNGETVLQSTQTESWLAYTPQETGTFVLSVQADHEACLPGSAESTVVVVEAAGDGAASGGGQGAPAAREEAGAHAEPLPASPEPEAEMSLLDVSSGDFTYTLEGDSCVITGYTGTETDVVIPAQLDGYPVTAIADWAFDGWAELASVQFPESLQTIGRYAFRNCTSLTELVLPEGLEEIESSAFSGCTGLERVDFPATLTTMGYYSFQNCTSLLCARSPIRWAGQRRQAAEAAAIGARSMGAAA